jgi:hypothetical protein
LLGLGRFFSFLILYTVGRTPWTGVQPIVRPFCNVQSWLISRRHIKMHASKNCNFLIFIKCSYLNWLTHYRLWLYTYDLAHWIQIYIWELLWHRLSWLNSSWLSSVPPENPGHNDFHPNRPTIHSSIILLLHVSGCILRRGRRCKTSNMYCMHVRNASCTSNFMLLLFS